MGIGKDSAVSAAASIDAQFPVNSSNCLKKRMKQATAHLEYWVAYRSALETAINTTPVAWANLGNGYNNFRDAVVPVPVPTTGNPSNGDVDP